MARSSKGSAFERQVCKELSQWWTKGERDDIFWRSAQSGGRAKFRGRKGKSTYGQHGDVAAVDPIGAELTELITIELKRGYNKASIQDMIDKPATAKHQEWEKWFLQTLESMIMAGTWTWMLITKRDRRCPLVHVPVALMHEIWGDYIPIPSVITTIDVEGRELVFCTMLLQEWFEEVDPERIRVISRKLMKRKNRNVSAKQKSG